MIALLSGLAVAQTVANGDLEAITSPIEVPNLEPHAVPDWTYGGDGVAPLVQAQVAQVGAPVYCVDLLVDDSPSNLASGGVLRHFAHLEGLDASPVGGVTNEWVETTVYDLVPGQAYRVVFEASIVRHLGQTPGFFRVSLGGESVDAATLSLGTANPGQLAWVQQVVDPFVADATEAVLRFEAVSLPTLASGTVTPPNDCGLVTVPGLTQLLLDGVRVVPDADGDGVFDDEDPCLGLGDLAFPGDQDSDGLLDDLEAVWGTDPCIADTDQDGLLDGEEVNRLLNTKDTWEGVQCPHPMYSDTDGDGLTDGEEVLGWVVQIGCDSTTTTTVPSGDIVASLPCDPNSDLDGLGDAAEADLQTNPLEPDTDGDEVWDHHDLDPNCAEWPETGEPDLDTYTEDEIYACCAAGNRACCDRSSAFEPSDKVAGCDCATGGQGPWWLVLPWLALARRRAST